MRTTPPGGRAVEVGGEWRHALLRQALLVSMAAAVIITCALTFMLRGPRGAYGLGVGAATVAVLALTTWRTRWRFDVRAGILVAVLYVATATTLATMGYAPAPILVGIWCVVAAGLLLGRRALYAVGALLLATIVLIGALQPHYRLLAVADDFAPQRMMPWARIALVYAVMVGAMSIALRTAVSILSRTLADRERATRQVADSFVTEERARDDRRAAEHALQEAQKLEAVGQLAAGLVHALNNGLTVIQLSASELRRAQPGTPAAAAAARQLSTAWRPAADVASQLLDLSRREPATTALIDAGDVMRDSEPALRSALPEDVQLVTAVANAAPIEANANRLRQAIVNLVLHARGAAALGSYIQLRVDVAHNATPQGVLGDVLPRGDYATIAVESTGATATAPIAHAFEPSNLGLFTTLGIVRNAGGTIAATQSSGGETTLQIYWPLATDADDAPRPPRADTPTPVLPPDAREHTPPDASVPSVGSVLAGDGDSLYFWRHATLHRVTTMLLPVYAAVLVVCFAVSSALFARVVPVIAACVVMLAVARYAAHISDRVRGFLVVAAVIGASLIITASGGFPPAAFAMSATGVMLAAALWGARALAASLGASVLAIVAGGVGVSAGWVEPMTTLFDPTSLEVWLRIACMMLFVLIILTTVVIRTIDSLHHATAERQRTLVALEQQRETARAAQTAQLEAERALAAADRADTLGRLAGSVAHDVNNALTVIGAWGPLLERAVDNADTVSAGLDAIDEALAQAVAITRQLAFDGAQLPFRAQPCDLQDATRRTAHTLTSVLPSSIAVRVDAPTTATVLADPTAIRQVLFNLALNARDAMPGGGTLTLRVATDSEHADGPRAVLEVVDTGEGMSDEVAARAFEPFFTTKVAASGTGLGLASVKRIVTTTGGELDLETARGVGTTIRMSWPMLGSSRMLSHPPPPLAQQYLSSAHVLLAEDEDLVRDGMTTALRRAGCQVVTASDGNEAARMLDDERVGIDLLCIDGIMPGVPTTQLIQRCQQRRPGAAILICSGHMPAELARRALTDDVVDFLLKPFSSDELLAKVADVLEQSRRHRAVSR